MKETVGRVLREFRLRAGLTQQELANKIGKSKQGVSRAEHGHFYPSLPTIITLSNACGVSPAQVLLRVADQLGDCEPGGETEALYREIDTCHAQLTEAGVPTVKTVELSLSERIALLAERAK